MRSLIMTLVRRPPAKRRTSSPRRLLASAAAVAVACSVAATLIHHRRGTLDGEGGGAHWRSSVSSVARPPSNPTSSLSPATNPQERHQQVLRHESYTIDGVDAFVQLPPLPSDTKNETSDGGGTASVSVGGVFLLFHGCNHDGKDWFLLPEERIVVRYLLSRSMAVIALSSSAAKHGEGSRCWSPTTDGPLVVAVVPKLLRQMLGPGAQTPPLFAIGASSGGAFVLHLMTAMKLEGAVSQIMGGHVPTGDVGRFDLPPRVAFVSMPRDERTEFLVRRSVEKLEGIGVAVRHYTCQPKAIGASWLAGRIDEMSDSQANDIVEALRKYANHDDAKPKYDSGSFLLSEDPRRFWPDLAVHPAMGGLDKNLIESLREELNLAFAKHELTSEHIDRVTNFLVTGS